MFKISFFIRKRSDVTRNDFRTYWQGEHADLNLAYVRDIGVKQYIKCEVLKDHPLTKASVTSYRTGPVSYDFVDQWIFNDIEDLKRGMADSRIQSLASKTHLSEDDWIDLPRSSVHMSTDLVQFYPVDAARIRATSDDPYLKVFYHVRSLPHISRESAQLHWNACHGGESRQHIHLSKNKKYLQAHKIDSTFVDQLTELRGYEDDPTIIGHAEAWLLADAEEKQPTAEEREATSMTLDDIDLFTNKSRSNVFLTNESFLLDDTIVTRPTGGGKRMPEFFSAIY